ncbi:23S rRNA (adenine(1618)-N(6))-methyltransferase RlmF [Coraliomargarita sp. W4R53]
MHPRNPHNGRYDFEQLCQASPDLASFLRPNPAGDQTIDFADAAAVLSLNRALLFHYYGVKHWMIPPGYLCPPIPGRADYIHYLADLIGETSPSENSIRVLDIGVGANCIYPIIGSQAYRWKFVGTEIDPVSVKAARAVVEANPNLKKQIRIVQQPDRTAIFKGLIKPSDRFAATVCNPPFHASAEAAQAGGQRKVKNLSQGRATAMKPALNFGGQNAELWCAGGELAFIKQMIGESIECADQVNWFTSLVSKSENLPGIEKALNWANPSEVKVIPMEQGSKQSRLIAWRF